MPRFSSRVMRTDDWEGINYFEAREFKNPDRMGFEFVHWLDKLREKSGVAMRITSSYRSPEYNARVGGANDSAHTDVPCDAVDVGLIGHPQGENYARYRLIKAALELGCERIGSYADGSLHFDMTHHKRPAPRIWRVVR